jgi:hypothetical protein
MIGVNVRGYLEGSKSRWLVGNKMVSRKPKWLVGNQNG